MTDLAGERSLAESLAQLRDVPIAKFTLGEHREDDFCAADVVVVNPAVCPTNQFVELAQQAGTKISSEIELFLDACPATVIGVTGTVGKSTTVAMLAAILQAAGRRTWLGGNIGHSLLGDLPQMQPDDIVVLELSSFQLHWLSDQARWPHGTIVTNCSPNHLDWHGSWEHYVAAKQRLLTHLTADGFCVLNTACPELNHWRGLEPRAPCATVSIDCSATGNPWPAQSLERSLRRHRGGFFGNRRADHRPRSQPILRTAAPDAISR